jgi:hypothetical protein
MLTTIAMRKLPAVPSLFSILDTLFGPDTSDGCGRFPFRMPKRIDPFAVCCRGHDYLYQSSKERYKNGEITLQQLSLAGLEADKRFYKCVDSQVTHAPWYKHWYWEPWGNFYKQTVMKYGRHVLYEGTTLQ